MNRCYTFQGVFLFINRQHVLPSLLSSGLEGCTVASEALVEFAISDTSGQLSSILLYVFNRRHRHSIDRPQ
mgnify:CR=1 FL=1